MEQDYRIMQMYNYLKEAFGVKSQNELAVKLGYNKSYLSQVRSGISPIGEPFFARLRSVNPDFAKISSRWVLTGEGEMLDGVSYYDAHATAECTASSTSEGVVPVVPCDIVRQPNVNVWKYVSENIDSIEQLTLSQLFPEHDLFYRAISNAMHPTIEKGDVLVLRRMPKSTQIIDGECYAIDTLSLGLLVRIAEDKGDALDCTATSENYGALTIMKSDICNVFAIVGMIRQNISPVSSNEPVLFEELQHRSTQIDNLIDEVKCQGKRMDKVLNLIDK